MNAKKVKKLRAFARQMTVGMPAVAYRPKKGTMNRTAEVAPGSTRGAIKMLKGVARKYPENTADEIIAVATAKLEETRNGSAESSE